MHALQSLHNQVLRYANLDYLTVPDWSRRGSSPRVGVRLVCGLLQEGGKGFIGNLVDIHKHFVMMFEECCDGDKDLHTVLKQAYARALACSPAPLPSPHYVCVHAKMCGVAAQGG